MESKVPVINFTFSEGEEARWLCLIERVNYISNKIEDFDEPELNLNDKRVARTVHKALCKYIDERFNAMLYDVHCANQKRNNFNIK